MKIIRIKKLFKNLVHLKMKFNDLTSFVSFNKKIRGGILLSSGLILHNALKLFLGGLRVVYQNEEEFDAPKLWFVRCWSGHVILHPSPLITFPSSHCSVPFLPRSLPLTFQLDPFVFSQNEKGLKLKCSWEKPKESGWRAKTKEAKKEKKDIKDKKYLTKAGNQSSEKLIIIKMII